MANETTTPVPPTPIELKSFGITLNSAANLDATTVAALESRLTPEFKKKAIEIEGLARRFQSLAEGLPSDISLSQAYAKLKATGGNIDDSAEPWLREFAAKVKDVPVVGSAIRTGSDINTLGDILGGVVNTGYDALMFLPRLASASAGKAKEFWHSFDPTMSGNEAKAFAVMYAATQQDAMASHDSLPMMTMPFDGKDSKVESNPVAYLMGAIKHWGSKLLNVPFIREASAGIAAICSFALQYVNKQPHERQNFSQLYAGMLSTISSNAANIGSVEDLARGSVLEGQRTAAANKLTGFFGENSLAGELSAAVAAQGAVRTKDGVEQLNGDTTAPIDQNKPGFVKQVTGKFGETMSTPGGVAGAVAATAIGLHQKERIVGAAVRVGTGAVDIVKGTGKFVAGTANMATSALGGTAAGLADGLGRTAGLGNTATKLGGNTAVGNVARTATNAVTDLVSGTAAKVTGAALAEAPAASAVASRTFRATQLGGKIVGRAAAPLAIATSAWDLVKGVEAYQAGDTEEATRRGTSVGFTASGAGIGAGIGVWFGGVGAAPGALIGAGVGGIADYFYGDDVANAIIGSDGKPVAQVAPEQQAQMDALAQAGRAAEARAQTARDAAKLATRRLQVCNPAAQMGAVTEGDCLRPSEAPSAADTLRGLGLAPAAPTRN